MSDTARVVQGAAELHPPGDAAANGAGQGAEASVAETTGGRLRTSGARPRQATRLNREQIIGFWAAWSGWLLDGMDSVIYALVLAPALTELLPRSGTPATPANVGFAGSVLFAVFLAGWGCAFLWGPIADKFGRTRALAATILMY